MNTSENYAREAARALIALRRESVRTLCTATGIGEPTLRWFLERGADEALSDGSFAALFAHLGVVATQAGPRLAPERVHYLHISGVPLVREREVRMFRALAPLLGAVSAMELPNCRGIAPILVRGGQTRVVLLVRTGLAGRVPLAKLGLLEGAFRDRASAMRTPRHCLELIATRQARRNYFDLILHGDCANESIELLRMAALDRDVTLGTLLERLKAGSGETPREEEAGEADLARGASVLSLAPGNFLRRAA